MHVKEIRGQLKGVHYLLQCVFSALNIEFMVDYHHFSKEPVLC